MEAKNENKKARWGFSPSYKKDLFFYLRRAL